MSASSGLAATLFGLLSFLSGTCSAAPPRVMLVGDSITVGLTPEQRPPYTGYRTYLRGMEVLGLNGDGSLEHSRSGWTAERLSSRAYRWATDYKPDIVLLLAGTNDLGIDGVSPKVAAKRVRRLMFELWRGCPKAHIAVASIPPVTRNLLRTSNNEIRQFNRFMKDAVVEFRKQGHPSSFLDSSSVFSASNTISADGIHPSLKGYRRLGIAWNRHLEQNNLFGWSSK